MKEAFKLYKIANKKSHNKFHQYFKGDKLYVSNYGRIMINDKIVEPIIYNKYGHCMFGHEYLHRIVYQLFVGQIPEGMEIDHIDTNPKNNCVENLRVVTSKENHNNHLTRKHKSESQQKKSVLQYTKQGIFVKEFESACQAGRETNIYQENICACCKGKLKSAGGFIWKYSNPNQ